MEEEDDIIAIHMCIWCCYKVNSFDRKLIKCNGPVYIAQLLCFMFTGLLKL